MFTILDRTKKVRHMFLYYSIFVFINVSILITGCSQNSVIFNSDVKKVNAEENIQPAKQKNNQDFNLPTPTKTQTTLTNISPSINEGDDTTEQQIDPIQFTFPTPAPEPITAWRPPLYPVPWEPTPHDHFYFYRPIGADQVNWPLANYRYGGVFFDDVVHTGIDIPAPKGTPVMAAGPGKVTWAGYGLYFLSHNMGDPYGLAVAIKHNFGYQGNSLFSVYAHMDEIYVYNGQEINAGDIIGIVGETGKVTGPHLHFEVRMGKNNFFGSRNPELWISPPTGWGILAARIMRADGDLLYRQSIIIRNKHLNKQWTVNTYGRGAVNSDTYYQENMVIGDLPAGEYVILTEYNDVIYKTTIRVKPGFVTYFSFRGKHGFSIAPPTESQDDFNPPINELP